MPRPETVICYICGRECSANSVKFHEKQCAKKWEAERHREIEKEKREEIRQKIRPRQRERVKSESSDDGERLKRTGSYSKLLSVKLGDETVRRKSMSADDLTRGSSSDDLNDKDAMHEARPSTVVLKKKPSSKERPSTVTLSSFKERSRTASASSASSNSSSSSVNATPNSSPKRKLPATPGKSGSATPVRSGSMDNLSTREKKSTATPHKPFQLNLVKCYICGKELTVHSIKIHEVQCMKKWDAQKEKEKRDTREERRFKRHSEPSLSSHSSRERLSASREKIGDHYDNKENGSVDTSSESSTGLSEDSKNSCNGKPNWKPCYICGREFSLKSLPIHEPQCRKKWEAYKSQKEKLEKRKSSPAKFTSTNGFNKSGLSPVQSKSACENCGRMFTVRQLAEHSKLCVQSPAKLRNQTKREDSARRNSRVTCYVCGREFSKGTIISHEPQCLRKHKQQKGGNLGKRKSQSAENIATTPNESDPLMEKVLNGSTVTQV